MVHHKATRLLAYLLKPAGAYMPSKLHNACCLGLDAAVCACWLARLARKIVRCILSVVSLSVSLSVDDLMGFVLK